MHPIGYAIVVITAAAILLGGCSVPQTEVVDGKEQKCIPWSPLTAGGMIVMAVRGVKTCGDKSKQGFDNLSKNSQ